MAGSLLRPPLNINPLTKKNNKKSSNSSTSSININNRPEQYKFLIKKYQQQQSLLSFKEVEKEGQQRLCKQLQQVQQASPFLEKLLLLLFAATNDSHCYWTAIEKRKDFKSLASTTIKIWTINYEQQQQQQWPLQQLHFSNRQQQQQQQLLQLDNKVLAATKKFRKNFLLNRKKVEKLQLQRQQQLQLQLKKEFLFYREKQLLRKFNLF